MGFIDMFHVILDTHTYNTSYVTFIYKVQFALSMYCVLCTRCVVQFALCGIYNWIVYICIGCNVCSFK